MEEILNTIGDTIGGFFDNPIVQFSIQALAFYIVILWLASAYWAFRDMQQRSDNPVMPYLAAALIVLFTPVLFLFGVIVYKIVRPHEKIGEVYERNLAEEALLAEVETIRTCPSCSRRVHDEWIICPLSHAPQPCANCGRLVGLTGRCARGAEDFERGDIAAFEPISSGSGDLDRTRHPRPRPGPDPAALHLARPRGRRRRRSASGPVSEPQTDAGRGAASGRRPRPHDGPIHRRHGAWPTSGTASEPAAPCITTFDLEGRACRASASRLGGEPAGRGSPVHLVQANVRYGQWVFLVTMLLLGVGLTFAAGSQAIERGRRPTRLPGPSPVPRSRRRGPHVRR
jgi:hypothetical protein